MVDSMHFVFFALQRSHLTHKYYQPRYMSGKVGKWHTRELPSCDLRRVSAGDPCAEWRQQKLFSSCPFVEAAKLR
jgi:hypothetical protein